MKALILAAGMGTRLTPLTNSIPKCMVQVNGKPIIQKQLECLMSNSIDDITVVVGYKADILCTFIHELYPDVKLIINNEYDRTNNMYSAYICKDVIREEPFLMMNADVFFDASVITALMKFKSDNAIVTDIGSYQEESMKVLEKDGRLISISKQIPQEQALGCSIDVYRFSKDAGVSFFKVCTEYIQGKGDKRLWSEVALNDILTIIEFKACPLSGRWMEIDDYNDLTRANMLFMDAKYKDNHALECSATISFL